MSKTILITGASKGIGAEIAKKFWFDSNGYTTLILVARESKEFEELTTFLSNKNPNGKELRAYEVDLSDRENTKHLVKKLAKERLNIDLLINNAGYTKPEPIQQISMLDWDITLNVNLLSPFILIQGLLKEGNSFETIINIASTAGIKGRSGWLTYSASKAAMINMSEVLREELRIYRTRVVCLAPGRCATGLRKILAPDEDPTTIMQPTDVAQVVSMLASDTGKFIDSEHIVVRL